MNGKCCRTGTGTLSIRVHSVPVSSAPGHRLVTRRPSRRAAREGGGALFFVSNDKTGTLTIEHSTLRDNPNAGFQTDGYPGIFFLGQGHPVVLSSTLS